MVDELLELASQLLCWTMEPTTDFDMVRLWARLAAIDCFFVDTID